MTTTDLLQNAITPFFPATISQSDEEILGSVWPIVSPVLTGAGLAGGNSKERLIEWIRTELLRVCRASGEAGQQILKTLSDEESAQDVERVALVIQFLVANFTQFQHLELQSLASFSILVLRIARKHLPKSKK